MWEVLLIWWNLCVESRSLELAPELPKYASNLKIRDVLFQGPLPLRCITSSLLDSIARNCISPRSQSCPIWWSQELNLIFILIELYEPLSVAVWSRDGGERINQAAEKILQWNRVYFSIVWVMAFGYPQIISQSWPEYFLAPRKAHLCISNKWVHQAEGEDQQQGRETGQVIRLHQGNTTVSH